MGRCATLLTTAYRVAPSGAHQAMFKLMRWAASGSADYGHYRSAVAAALDSVGLLSPQLLQSVCELPAKIHAEQHLIRYGPAVHLRQMQADLDAPALAALQAVLARGRGLILGCTHIGLFHHALIQSARLNPGREILIVTGNPNHRPAVVERLAAVSQQALRVINAGTSSAMTVARHLKNGGVVATMLDIFVNSTKSMVAPFFGRPAATPAGVFQLAVSLKTPVVPLAVVGGQSGQRRVIVDEIVEPGGSVLELATLVNARIEALVRSYPDQWSAWPSLPHRWNSATR